MAAIFDRSDPASPLAHDASKTALILLDFQGFAVDRCGLDGRAALNKAQVIRDWAVSREIVVIHSIADVAAKPSRHVKGANRLVKMLAGIENNRTAAEESPEIAPRGRGEEYVVLKPPGVVSGFKSVGILELLHEHGIESLVLCGLKTSGAVLWTALAASDDGFVVSVISDACADLDTAMHENLMSTVLQSRGHVCTAERFISEWSKEMSE